MAASNPPRWNIRPPAPLLMLLSLLLLVLAVSAAARVSFRPPGGRPFRARPRAGNHQIRHDFTPLKLEKRMRELHLAQVARSLRSKIGNSLNSLLAKDLRYDVLLSWHVYLMTMNFSRKRTPTRRPGRAQGVGIQAG